MLISSKGNNLERSAHYAIVKILAENFDDVAVTRKLCDHRQNVLHYTSFNAYPLTVVCDNNFHRFSISCGMY